MKKKKTILLYGPYFKHLLCYRQMKKGNSWQAKHKDPWTFWFKVMCL